MTEKAFELWPGMCHEPVYGPAGFGSASRPVPHDWRLVSREEIREKGEIEYVEQPGAPGYGTVTMTPGKFLGHHEVWYCTRCRTVDERDVQ